MEGLKPIQHLFPVTVNVTQEMIDKGKANITSPSHCIGAIAVRKVITDNRYVSWANSCGCIETRDSWPHYYFQIQSFDAITHLPVVMEHIISPQNIILKEWKI